MVSLPKVAIVSFAEDRGGAAKASERLFRALRARDIDAEYIVVEKKATLSQARAPGRYAYAWHFLKRLFAFSVQQAQRSSNPTKHSLNLFSCGFVLRSLSKFDLIHLHWINNETIAINQLEKINGSVVVSLHDEWLYCGTEHYALESQRPFDGYTRKNKDVVGFDLDRRAWEGKTRAMAALKSRVILTAPSSWIMDRARASKTLAGFDVRLVPNVVDTETFSQREEPTCLTSRGVPIDAKVILFGAVRGRAMRTKGFHLLLAALAQLTGSEAGQLPVYLITFGGSLPQLNGLGVSHIELGPVTNSGELAALYSRATFTAVPSLVESFGQIAAESLACETPVLGFDTSGIRDIVTHTISGYLATPFSVESLAVGIAWLLSLDSAALKTLGAAGRRHVVDNFSEQSVVDKVLALYQDHARGGL